GATVTISSMLLTDPLSSEVVTYLYFLAGTLCVYSMLRRCTNNWIIPGLGLATCIGAFLFTFHPIYLHWGQFQKHHEFTASLLMSVVWLLAIIRQRTSAIGSRAWMIYLAFFTGHCVLFAPTVFPLVFGVLGLVGGTAWL